MGANMLGSGEVCLPLSFFFNFNFIFCLPPSFYKSTDLIRGLHLMASQNPSHLPISSTTPLGLRALTGEFHGADFSP